MKYCLIGKNLTHSYSQILHNGFGTDYVLKNVAEDGLEEFIKCGYDGFNVTIPYKKQIIPLLYSVSCEAKAIGAVNTVKREGDKLYGYNTDIFGVIATFNRFGVDVKGKNALILGTGGAAAVVGYALEKLGAGKVEFVSRTGEINYANCYGKNDTEIIVNATPVGTYPNFSDSPVDIKKFPALKILFDLVYNPHRTRLLLDADEINGQSKEKKITAFGGATMLTAQALEARRIWTGIAFNGDDIKRGLKILKDATLNIAVCGMPSTGKSTVGKVLGEAMGRKFIDTDYEIEKEEGMSPAKIIEKFGEEKFRETESRIVNKVCKEKGVIISLGGGAVIKKENRDILRQTAMNVFLKRDFACLSDRDRPLLKTSSPEELYAARKDFYKEVADVCVTNDGTPQKAAREIMKAYENFDY